MSDRISWLLTHTSTLHRLPVPKISSYRLTHWPRNTIEPQPVLTLESPFSPPSLLQISGRYGLSPFLAFSQSHLLVSTGHWDCPTQHCIYILPILYIDKLDRLFPNTSDEHVMLNIPLPQMRSITFSAAHCKYMGIRPYVSPPLYNNNAVHTARLSVLFGT